MNQPAHTFLPAWCAHNFILLTLVLLATLSIPIQAVTWTENFDDGDISDWTVRNPHQEGGTPIFLGLSTGAWVTPDYSLKVHGGSASGEGAMATGLDPEVDLEQPYSIYFSFRYNSFHWYTLVSYGPVNLILDRSYIKLKYNNGSVGTLGSGTFETYCPYAEWTRFRVDVTPATTSYAVYAEDALIGAVNYGSYDTNVRGFRLSESSGSTNDGWGIYYDNLAIVQGTVEDCNANGQPDALDVAFGDSEDCQSTQVPDECEIDSGTSLDGNSNAIPDECEGVPWFENLDDGEIGDWTVRNPHQEGGTAIFLGLSTGAWVTPDYSLKVHGGSASGEGAMATGPEPFVDLDQPYSLHFSFRYNSFHWFTLVQYGPVHLTLDRYYIKLKYNNGSVGTLGSGTFETYCAYADWTRFRVDVDPTTTSYAVYADDALIGTVNYGSYDSNVRGFRLSESSGNTNDGWGIYYDNLAILQGDFDDCNTNGLADLMEVAFGYEADCQHNWVPDACDIASGSSLDENSDGIPDECIAPTDGDSDGWFTPEDCDDTNPDIYPDAIEICDGIDNQCPGDTGYGQTDEGPPVCSDGDACTTDDVCSGGTCVGGAALVCDDVNVCTDDSCDSASGCVFVENTDSCDDGDACTTDDTCAAGNCTGGSALVCDDTNDCTDDSCDSGSGCVFTDNTEPCDDGDMCTTEDTCSAGSCAGGTALVCNDGDVCTDDSCDPGTGCFYSYNTAPCDDGDACLTGDTCFAGTCLGMEPLACDDDNVCTHDSCDSEIGCVNDNNTLPCDDDSECTTVDYCTDGVCNGGPPLDCSDECTTDECHPQFGCINNVLEVATLVMSNKTTLAWQVPSEAGLDVTYDVVRGELTSLPVGVGVEICHESGLAAVTTTDTTPASPGFGFWYLVRAKDEGCGVGTYGYEMEFGGIGLERLTGTCPVE